MFGDGLRVDLDGRVTRKMFSYPWGLRSYLYGGCPIVQQSTFFKKSAFDSTAGFNIENTTCWDGELLVDMALAGARFKDVRHTLGAFRVYANSISGSGRLEEQYLKDKLRIKQKVLGGEDSRLLDFLSRGYYKSRKTVKRPAGVFSRISSALNDL